MIDRPDCGKSLCAEFFAGDNIRFLSKLEELHEYTEKIGTGANQFIESKLAFHSLYP